MKTPIKLSADINDLFLFPKCDEFLSVIMTEPHQNHAYSKIGALYQNIEISSKDQKRLFQHLHTLYRLKMSDPEEFTELCNVLLRMFHAHITLPEDEEKPKKKTPSTKKDGQSLHYGSMTQDELEDLLEFFRFPSERTEGGYKDGDYSEALGTHFKDTLSPLGDTHFPLDVFYAFYLTSTAKTDTFAEMPEAIQYLLRLCEQYTFPKQNTKLAKEYTQHVLLVLNDALVTEYPPTEMLGHIRAEIKHALKELEATISFGLSLGIGVQELGYFTETIRTHEVDVRAILQLLRQLPESTMLPLEDSLQEKTRSVELTHGRKMSDLISLELQWPDDVFYYRYLTHRLRVYDYTPEQTYVPIKLVIDCSTSMNFEGGRRLLYARSCALALIRHYYHMRRPFEVIYFNGAIKSHDTWSPNNAPHVYHEIITRVLTVKNSGGTSLNHALRYAETYNSRSYIITITDCELFDYDIPFQPQNDTSIILLSLIDQETDAWIYDVADHVFILTNQGDLEPALKTTFLM